MLKGCKWCGDENEDLRFGSCYSCAMRKTKIISGFPAIGKSYFSEWSKVSKKTDVHDSDSSEFSWIKDDNGNNTDKRNPEFPNNYIKHIKKLMNDKKYDFILISTHKQVRGALVENNIPFLLVYPAKSLKNEYMDRFKSRGNKQGFLNLMDKNWDVFIQELNDQKGCAKEILGKSKYLMSIFE